jgi:CRISPR/Cas system-associated endonuclease/helicase Cas3
MTNWTEEIDLSDLRRRHEAEELTFEAFRDGIADKLAASKWAREEERVRELIEDLRRAETDNEFDDELEYIYNAADDDAVWIGFY